MGKLSVRRKNGATLITLDSSLEISVAKELYAGLDDAMKRSPENLNIDAGKVKKVDTPCLQIFIAFVMEAKKRKKKVSWVRTSKEFQRSAGLLGADGILGFN